MRPHKTVSPRDLGMRFLTYIQVEDIWLALNEGTLECTQENLIDLKTMGAISLEELTRYHRQLFLWRMMPVLLSCLSPRSFKKTHELPLHSRN